MTNVKECQCFVVEGFLDRKQVKLVLVGFLLNSPFQDAAFSRGRRSLDGGVHYKCLTRHVAFFRGQRLLQEIP